MATSSRGVFSSAVSGSKRELVVKKDSLSPKQAGDIEEGRDDSLYSVTTLNHLELSGFTGLGVVSPKITNLDGLFQLILTNNGLSTLPTDIGSLQKLKLLDVSRNKLETLPAELYKLQALQTIILADNLLTESSFPPLADDTFTMLHYVDLANNKLTKLPEFVYRAHNIQDLFAPDNSIDVLLPGVGAFAGLRQLDLKRNKIKLLPFDVTKCSKLRTLKLEDNLIEDRRLLKLIVQHGSSKPKAILDYISSRAPQPTTSSSAGKKIKGKKKKAPQTQEVAARGDDDDSDVEVLFEDVKPVLQVLRPARYVEVRVSADARRVRPYFVCAMVRGVQLAEDDRYKEFIALQTKLHDTVCKRRRVATIATHDLAKLSPPLSLVCQPAAAISITPLGQTEGTTAQLFLELLEANKYDSRKGGGRRAKPQDPAAAALSKYAQFVDASEMVCLHDSRGVVVSLPPLTNSDQSKIEPTTSDVLLEVTSTESLASCKSVMDALVVGMCECGVGVSSEGVMVVEQGRVVEAESGQLLVLYPSKIDLTSDVITVKRPL